MGIKDWNLTSNSNSSIDTINIAENCAFANMNDAVRALMGNIRTEFAGMQTTVTAAALATISGNGQFVPMAGATTITAFDTAVTGLFREIYASSTLIFGPTTALGLQSYAANVTLVPGDRLRGRSLGAGTWASKIDAPSTIADLSISTAKLAANAVTFAKMQAITDGKLLGASGGTAVEEITVGTGLSLAANTLSATSSGIPYNYIGGCTLSNNSGTPNTKIDIAAGQCSDTTNAATITVAATTIDFTTTGANGLDAGSIANSTKYAIYAIAKADGTQAGLASTSFTAPTMPATYTVKRRLGWVETDGSAHLVPFIQTGRRFQRVTPTLGVNGTAVSTTRVNLALDLPTGKKWPVFLKITTRTDSGAIRAYGYFCDPDRTDQAISLLGSPLRTFDTIDAVNQLNTLTSLFIMTNTSAEISAKCVTAIAAFVVVEAWEDDGL